MEGIKLIVRKGRGGLLVVTSLHAAQVALLVILTDIFPFVSVFLRTGETKVSTLYSSIKPGNLFPFSLSDHQESINLSTETYSFRDVASINWENQGQHLLWNMRFVTYLN
jgi:hypothetical protein